MSDAGNTLLLRLAGPMQSWGTASRFQLRRTDAYPSKSGVLGLILCARGIGRENSASELERLAPLLLGVRIDRPGTSDWDYHSAGAGIGIRSADGKIKKTASTGKYETLLSRRQYLYDASFLVALQGPPDIISDCAAALENPIWPMFLGRKCCVPAEPVLVGRGSFDSPAAALGSIAWQPRLASIDRGDDWKRTRTLDAMIEHQAGSPPPAEARLVHDVPRGFGFHNHGPRWVVPTQVTVPVGPPLQTPVSGPAARRVDYTAPQWKIVRRARLELDHHLCVFCKAPAEEVHHVSYEHVGEESNDDLRSLCQLCHDACTMLEYGRDLQSRRIDPADVNHRQEILDQIQRLLRERRAGRRRDLLEAAAGATFFDDVPDSLPVKDR